IRTDDLRCNIPRIGAASIIAVGIAGYRFARGHAGSWPNRIRRLNLLRRRGGAAQFGEVVAAGEEGLDVAGGLAQTLAVLDEREAHEPLAVLAKANPRRDRDVGAFEQQL